MILKVLLVICIIAFCYAVYQAIMSYRAMIDNYEKMISAYKDIVKEQELKDAIQQVKINVLTNYIKSRGL